jgi:formylmethanofuran dehydrogenase subunit E
MNLELLLEKSARDHSHLCPRQILGVRLGLAGLRALGFLTPPGQRRLLVITETDGCFADGLSAATGCTLGHRTLRVEDYGKTAAVFADAVTGQCVRVAPARDLREKASAHLPDEPSRYRAQLQSYQRLPDEEMFTSLPVTLAPSLAELLSRPGLRVPCAGCGEEIMNEREIRRDGLVLCRSCARGGYYRPLEAQ